MKKNHKKVARNTMRIRNRNRINILRSLSFRFEPVFILVLIKLDLNNKTSAEVRDRLTTYITGLTGNANFPTTSPTIAQLTAARDQLAALILSAANGDRLQIELRNMKQKECEEGIRSLSYDIQYQSGGDAEKIHSSGFETRKEPVPASLPAQVLNLKVKTNAFDGQLQLRWKAVPHKLAYVVAITETPTDPKSWNIVDKTGKANMVVKDLKPGITYFFRVFAFNSLGDGPPSEVADGHC